MLRGWHANNGVALKNLKLGFVCTKQTVDVQDGLEGYYYEYDRDLAVDERLVFARHLEAPPFDPARAPALPVDAWPKPRLEKAYRNYAMEYVRTAAPVMVQLFGPEDAGHLLHRTAKLIGMQFFPEVAAALAGGQALPLGPADFAAFLSAVLAAQDDPSTDGRAGRRIRRHPAGLAPDGRRCRLPSGLRTGAGRPGRGAGGGARAGTSA